MLQLETFGPPDAALAFLCFLHPSASWGAPAGHFWNDTVALRRKPHNHRQSESHQLIQLPRAPAEVTLWWLTSRTAAVNQRRVTASGCSAPSHRLSRDYCEMKSEVVYRRATLEPFRAEHAGNDKVSVRCVSALHPTHCP